MRALIILGILWALGGYLYLPSTEHSLAAAANAKLADGKQREIFKQVKAEFSGQQAILRGVVGTEEDKQLAERIVRDEIQVPKERFFNPVKAVHNEIRVDPAATSRKPQWLIASIQPGGVRVDGLVQSPAQITQLMEQFAPKVPATGGTPDAAVVPNGLALPAADWTATLAKIPDFKALLEGKMDKERGLLAVSACDGNWSVLLPAATDEEITAKLNLPKISAAEISRPLTKLRAWFNGPSQAELDRLATEAKAKQEAQIKAQAEVMAKAAADAKLAADAAAAAKLAAAGPALPAYVGVAVAAKTLNLFGAVPDEAVKTLATTTALKSYPGRALDSSNLKLEPNRTLPTPVALTLPAAPPGKADFLTLAQLDGTSKLYNADAFDSEITKDFPALKFKADDLALPLLGFRSALATAGSLAKDEPYLALVSDGTTLNLTGEVAAEATKSLLLEKIKAANPALTLVDKLQVSPLVNDAKDLAATLDSLPAFAPGTPTLAVARPGQKWRPSVVHAIYFKTGSNRSKDQERAIYQMQRVLELLPQARFEIVGHTDNAGNAETNKKLSLERANSFLTVATAAGLEPAKLSTRGAGPAEPIASNDTADGKALNRRVDVLLK